MEAVISQPIIRTDLLTEDELRKMDAYWRAANYLSVGQIYVLDNPRLRELERLAHVKPRLLLWVAEARDW